MGIQVIAYTGLQKQFPESEKETNALRAAMYVNEDPNLAALTPHPAWPERADYLSAGIYRFDEYVHNRLGPDGDFFASFLAVLSAKFLKRPYNEAFAEFQPGPFAELVNFRYVGNGLLFGPQTAAKLAQDFKDHAEQAAKEAAKEGAYFHQTFVKLGDMFTWASEAGGAVAFSNGI